ncbi:MAG TPA: IS701 family transposase [Solirubrobacteraceae bacterium]|nr:IS701 family transposase [Solirubrobacteraceae bacterium]
MLPRNAPVWLNRLSDWLEPFEDCFGHVAQRGAFRRYLVGLLSDSRRKSMSAMLARVSDPGTYQSFQHFITDAPWAAAPVWQRLRATIRDREGVLILDGTSFPKQGKHSVGVARQYCGTLGKIANCQVAVTAALWTGTRAWMLGASLYLPDVWLTPDQRQRARVPATVRFQEKWRLALTLVRQVRASGITVTAVLGDAEFGDNATLRRTLHRAKLPYALGVSSTLTVFPGTPALTAPPPLVGKGRPRTRRLLASGVQSVAASALAAEQPAKAWRLVTWRNGTNRPWRARFFAHRVTPAHDWRDHRLAPEVWLLCERDLGTTPRTKYYLVDLPWTASLKALVQLAHQRWAIEQQYQELKDELGLDHFEGRSLPGWQRHVVLTALAYAWLQHERCRRGARLPTLPIARAVITEILTAHFLVTHPHYLDTMLKLKDISLRI